MPRFFFFLFQKSILTKSLHFKKYVNGAKKKIFEFCGKNEKNWHNECQTLFCCCRPSLLPKNKNRFFLLLCQQFV